ncbi:MAG: hypothetical protein NWQ54_08830 [Paraglaciecola sp.]|uniref:hypothetical protein n=1 Tax=Pseudomonadati TaxID=3379134 RepID=UPI00273F8E60|nr:hypothetical protein [Paraglaciecola sp.]MDP5029857.1 hypothetical protein [Paraglaciecola sp.]MDP5039277.1 hypothetical protein [Paraglaciecola sp.]MDP5130977.1 hypothetical protein [Paraglaciecola sp.]
MNWLHRFANDTPRRWTEFKLGLGIFTAGAILILVGAQDWIWLQVPGLLLLVVGGLVAARGYLGILVFRLTGSFNKAKPPASLFDTDK